MKKTSTLLTLLLSCLFASAQVCEKKIDNSRVIVGVSDTTSRAVQAGLFRARFDLLCNEIALVAGANYTAAYYTIYDEYYRVVIACGRVAMVKEGEYIKVKVGRPADKCRVVLSSSPSLAHKL